MGGTRGSGCQRAVTFCGLFTAALLPRPCRAKLGKAPNPAPRWLGNVLAWVLGLVGPQGLEFAKYSVDYHYIR
jgi:7-hydroxymethyl chlorophyll a reductase